MFSVKAAVKEAGRHSFLVVLFYSLLFIAFFSPVLFFDSLLAPGDGLFYHLPYFESEKELWDLLLAAGFPMMADPQVMTWYPPALLLSPVPGAWNVFVVSAYVMASCFTYGYVYALTESKFSSLVSGIIYGMCGFMMAHLGHTAIIHSAVWLPLIIWSLEMLRRRFSRGWLAIGSLAIACCVLAGHLQITTYSLLSSTAYAAVIGWTAPAGRWRFYWAYLVLLMLGIGLTALQILPTAELASLSTRTNFGFPDFVSYSLPFKHFLLMIFPAVFGGLPRYGGIPYFGEWNLTEMSAYVGLLPLMLAAVGFVIHRRESPAIFWLCLAIVALLLALGDSTPFAYFFYHVPVIGKFRAPARHVIEFAFACSVLAGFGVNAIQRRQATRRLVVITISAGAAIMSVALLGLLSGWLSGYALAHRVENLNAVPWSNPAVGIPLMVFLTAVAALVYWQRQHESPLRQALLLLILVLDLASFGWFYEWHDFAPRKEVLAPPDFVTYYKNSLHQRNQRILSVRGTRGKPGELPPNLSRLWGIPNATGYTPLMLASVTDLLSMLPDGSIAPRWKEASDQGLNLAAVRYVFLPRPEHLIDPRGILWDAEDMDLWLGSGCNHPSRDSIKFNLSIPARATTVAVVSRLACSPPVEDAEEVVRFTIRDSAGAVETKNMIAGRDTAEWAYDCPNVKPQIKHRQAQIFSSFPAKMYDIPCEGHFYVAFLNLDSSKDISQIEAQWVGRTGAITIDKISLIDDQGKSSVPVNAVDVVDGKWRFVESAGEALIYENMKAMPRAWLVSEAIALKHDDILKAIKTSVLPGGRAYDPARTVLLEERSPPIAAGSDPAAAAQIEQLTETTMEVRTSSVSPGFLVTSDNWYPGWQATVDGVPTVVFRANYALRGVSVPAGQHVVRFEFRPRKFYFGVTISVLSLVILGAILVVPFRKSSNQIFKVDTGEPAP